MKKLSIFLFVFFGVMLLSHDVSAMKRKRNILEDPYGDGSISQSFRVPNDNQSQQPNQFQDQVNNLQVQQGDDWLDQSGTIPNDFGGGSMIDEEEEEVEKETVNQNDDSEFNRGRRSRRSRNIFRRNGNLRRGGNWGDTNNFNFAQGTSGGFNQNQQQNDFLNQSMNDRGIFDFGQNGGDNRSGFDNFGGMSAVDQEEEVVNDGQNYVGQTNGDFNFNDFLDDLGINVEEDEEDSSDEEMPDMPNAKRRKLIRRNNVYGEWLDPIPDIKKLPPELLMHIISFVYDEFFKFARINKGFYNLIFAGPRTLKHNALCALAGVSTSDDSQQEKADKLLDFVRLTNCVPVLQNNFQAIVGELPGRFIEERRIAESQRERGRRFEDEEEGEEEEEFFQSQNFEPSVSVQRPVRQPMPVPKIVKRMIRKKMGLHFKVRNPEITWLGKYNEEKVIVFSRIENVIRVWEVFWYGNEGHVEVIFEIKGAISLQNCRINSNNLSCLDIKPVSGQCQTIDLKNYLDNCRNCSKITIFGNVNVHHDPKAEFKEVKQKILSKMLFEGMFEKGGVPEITDICRAGYSRAGYKRFLVSSERENILRLWGIPPSGAYLDLTIRPTFKMMRGLSSGKLRIKLMEQHVSPEQKELHLFLCDTNKKNYDINLTECLQSPGEDKEIFITNEYLYQPPMLQRNSNLQQQMQFLQSNSQPQREMTDEDEEEL